ncbi:MAG TPA: hypothetical protein PLX67_01800 [bacterium]|nr:hypothetical protein [bacterium]
MIELLDEPTRIKVLVISRHYPSYQQFATIKRECGDDCLITMDSQRFNDAAEIMRRYRQGGYDEIALVAPKDVLANLVASGLQPIHLLTIEVSEGDRQPGDFNKGESLVRAIARKIRKVEVNITYY